MLVLTRSEGQRILIGDQITVTVVRISPRGVRIGIQAPSHLAIVREELGQPETKREESAGPPHEPAILSHG